MLSSYPVACPHERCGWTGSLIPSLIQGGEGAEIASMSQASSPLPARLGSADHQ